MSTCSNEGLNIFYGFVHLSCGDNDSEIQVTLAPAVYEEGTNSFVLVRNHCQLISLKLASSAEANETEKCRPIDLFSQLIQIFSLVIQVKTGKQSQDSPEQTYLAPC